MNLLNLLTIVIVVAFLLLLVLIVWGTIARRRAAAAVEKRRSLEAGMDVRIQEEEGERLATPISEEIEEMVRRILAAQGDDLADSIDFATGEDGSLEIWVEGRCYSTPDEIADGKVREAVQQAVEEFNRQVSQE